MIVTILENYFKFFLFDKIKDKNFEANRTLKVD